MIDPLILVRGVHLIATALAAGTAGFIVLVAEPAFRRTKEVAAAEFAALRRRWSRLIVIALAVAIVSGASWLVLLASDLYGAPIVDVCLHGGAWSVASQTRFGLIWGVRLLLALLLAVLLLWPNQRLAPLLAAGGLIGSLALIGHAGASPGPSGNVQLAADVLHLLAAGAWVGSLPALAWLMGRARRAQSESWNALAGEAARGFSPLGITAAGTLAVTGLINAWYLVGTPGALVATDYGRLILLKIGLFAAMLGIASVNRFRLTPRLALASAIGALERNAFAETALGLCILLFVGALGTLEPSAHNHVHVASGPIDPDAAFVHIHTEQAMADVSILPGRPGVATISIRLMREDFSILPADAIDVVLAPREPAGAPSIRRPAIRLPDGTWKAAGLEIRQAGVWIVKLTIRIGNSAPFVLDAPIVIDR